MVALLLRLVQRIHQRQHKRREIHQTAFSRSGVGFVIEDGNFVGWVVRQAVSKKTSAGSSEVGACKSSSSAVKADVKPVSEMEKPALS